MVKKSPSLSSPVEQEHRKDAPPGWINVQERLAEASGLSILLVEGHQPPALAISNNNSICNALQSSPAHVALCDPYCGIAHKRATTAGETIRYKCHAGFECFAQPVDISGKKNLAVIGG
ncbi:MAG: PocR ligand-binding domain-containing protein, partial [Pyrinomonadaceae bacterium]